MTKKCNRLRGERPKAFWGALVGGAMNLIGSAISSKSQARAIRRQIEAQKEAARTQLELANNSNLASTLNSYATATRSYNDEDDYNLKYRLGGNKRLGSNRIYITDGGNATKIGNDTYLLRGGSHEQTNETGQTGIGINVGGNEIEAEGGEVAQKKNGALRIFSAQPMLGGISPAQAVMSGANKDKVFNAQQKFKKRHHLSDGGDKAKHGTEVPYKRIHINEDGTFTDTLTGKNYNTSATNGEDVVITGKANHWKEAGKKNTSSYFDPMGAVNFATAAGAPILNANPSNVVGSIRDSKNFNDFVRHYMMQDTGGFVNTKWAKEHPYLSLGINTVGDIGLGYGLGKAGVSLYRLRPSNLRKHIFENISPIGYDKPIPRIKEAFKSALSGAEADIDNPSWFNDKSAQDLNTYNVGITKNMFGPHALEARFDAWRKYLGLPQKFNTWTESPIVKGAYTDTKGISNLKVLPKDQSVDFINSAGGNVANNIEEFTTRGYNGQKYGVSHIRDTWDLQPWSRLRGNIIEDKVIRPLYNSTIGKANRKVSSGLHKFINKYGYDNEAIQKYLNENGEKGLNNLSDVIEYFADTKSIKGKIAHKLSGLDDVLNDKAYYTMNKDSKLSKLTNKLSNKIKNFEASSLLPGAKPFKIAYDIPWTNKVFPNNEMVKGFNMIDTLPTEAYRYKLKNPLLDYTYRLGGRCKLRNGGLTSKDRGSSKHPYPSVSSKDFAGGGRSYPIPTKADAVDALRLAGLHGRSDVKSKVYSRYPELRKKAEMGTWVKPVYNTSKYRGTSRARRQIAKWEGSDFAGQNAQFKGDAIRAKERELRQFMGKGYNYLNDNQRDALLSYYYNVGPKSFRGQMTKYRNALINAQTEQEYNDTLNNMRESINIGANRKGMSGLRNRRAIERNWFGYTTPMNTNQTRAILKQQDDAKLVQPTDNTRVVIQPQYIEVPAPVGHGIVPVDNPDPNLLQGNIKDNLINMGNKFRLGQRCGGSTRVRKSLGGESRPVKGMRRKLTWGDVTYPYRRNNNFDYWDIIDQEQKANDKGGISPWTTSNNYDVKVPYAITKSTPTIPYTSKVSTPTSGVSENKTIPTYIGNKSGMIIRDADWYGLGADLVSSIGGSILGLGAYKNLDFDYNLPNFVEESPVALNTTYHNEAQKSNVERNRLNSRNSILRNTMSGSTAIGRMQGVDTNALYQLNQLADEKTNKETELMNQNLLNEQQVRARNAAARNQYYNTVASIKNAAIQAKNEAELAKGQILSGSLQGIGNSFQNFISQGRQNYDDTQAMLMGVAASDYATPSRLLELGVDVGDDAALAGIYRSAMNVPNPGARPKREDYSDNTEYSYALTRWENQNKAYQRRNSYADLIKGRMSKKNLIKYGII